MATSIVKEREVPGAAEKREVQAGHRGAVVTAVMGDISTWRKHRDAEFDALWTEYYAKWRGFWNVNHKSYKTERSKIISPLTSMSIDLTSAEIIEAIFGREYFIDLPDNVLDDDKADMEQVRNLLVQDLKNDDFIDEFALTVLNGCLYGTGITKIQILTKIKKTPTRNDKGELVIQETEVVHIKPIAIEPGQFVGDPGARSIDEMTGCAHEFMMPLHLIEQRQLQGVYYNNVKVGAQKAKVLSPDRGDTPHGKVRGEGETAFITEYYGLLSRRIYMRALAEAEGQELSEEIITGIPSSERIEVIITIANETHLLRVIENPNPTGERLMVSYQHEAVPGRFYGRGVAEKGMNVQRAMDAEMRARIDALAWSNNPMFAGDLTRMPPGANLNAWPGKFWGTRGNPSEVLQEFKLSGLDQSSFAHTAELAQMGQQATGALDAQSLRSGMRDETATGSALAASSFIKRSKRTMYNIEGYMNRLVRRVLHLKMKFDAKRYPNDYEFQVRGGMGIMAREIEQQFLTNLASVLGNDHPATMPIIRGIFEHSGSPVKSDVLAALKAIEEQKPSQEEEAAKAAQLMLPVKELEKITAEIQKITAEAGLKTSQTAKTDEETENLDQEADFEELKVMDQLQQTQNQARQLDLMDDKNALTAEGLRIQEKAIDKQTKGSK